MPQVNVNDETVLLVRWSVPQYAEVGAGEVVCLVETSKASSEVEASRAGVLMQTAEVGTRIRIGAPIGAIGPTKEAVVAFAAARPDERSAGTDRQARATPKARGLAAEHGVAI